MFEKFFLAIDEFIEGIDAWLGRPAASYVEPVTPLNPHTMVTQDASLVSVLEIQGVLVHKGKEAFAELVDHLSGVFATRLNRPGHLIQIGFAYHPGKAREELRQATSGMYAGARAIGVNMDGFCTVMDDWLDTIAKHCAWERAYVALWTTPAALSKVSQRMMTSRMAKEYAQAPKGKRAMAASLPESWRPTEIVDAHEAFVNTFEMDCRKAGLLVRKIRCKEWLHETRHWIDPETTGPECFPRLADEDPLPVHLPDRWQNDYDMQSLLYPSISSFLFPRPAEDISHNITRIGDTWHASFVMALGPADIKPFADFFQGTLRLKMPWRMTMMFDHGGMNAISWKPLFTSILGSKFFQGNARFNVVNEMLHDLQINGGDTIAKFKMVWSTVLHDEPDKVVAKAEIRRRMHELVSVVQSWGGIDVDFVIGDPILGLTSSLPGLMKNIPARTSAAPLRHPKLSPLIMAPITRPARIWEHGSLIYRTRDGRILPYAHVSSKQASWIDIGVAPMGGGKSVTLNVKNFTFCFQGGLENLPHVSIIDIGPSSSGLIRLLEFILPPSLKHQVIYQRLRMTEECAINPCDLPLMFHKPYPAHLSFLVNFLSLLATELDSDSPPEAVPAIARACIEAAYEEYSPAKNPRPYVSGVCAEIDEAIDGYSLHIDEHTSWWEIVEQLFDRGEYHLASVAQRLAVPTLAEVAQMAKRDIVSGIYKHDTEFNEKIVDFFWRSIVDAIKAYPIIGKPTRFDLGDARVIALDLDEVAPRGGPEADRQTGVMFMLARHVCAGKMFLMPEDVKFAHPKARAYHTERIEEIRRQPKRISWDEVHRIVRNSSVAKQLIADMETAGRESRKWNLSIGLYSQHIDDFPEIMVELATTIYILGAGKPQTAKMLVERFGLPDDFKAEIMRLGKPDARGANFVGVFTTSDGYYAQVMTNTIGPVALWAFSSVAEDREIRDRLYDKIGVQKTLKALARLYPGGIKAECDRIRQRSNLLGDHRSNVYDQVMDSLMENIRQLEQDGKL